MIRFGGLAFRLNCLKPPVLFVIRNVSSQRVSMCWSLDKPMYLVHHLISLVAGDVAVWHPGDRLAPGLHPPVF